MEAREKGIHRREFVKGFFEYRKAHNSPMDFFTWHSFFDIESLAEFSKFYDTLLKEYGLEGIEAHLNEWNGPHKLIQRCNSYASSQAAATMPAMQNISADLLCYYDAPFGEATNGEKKALMIANITGRDHELP
ncbi:MAG: hypothetical protein IJN80_03035 [Clostridia bacterium]|nr:hypothetical protein [Clostridia bacterium]